MKRNKLILAATLLSSISSFAQSPSQDQLLKSLSGTFDVVSCTVDELDQLHYFYWGYSVLKEGTSIVIKASIDAISITAVDPTDFNIWPKLDIGEERFDSDPEGAFDSEGHPSGIMTARSAQYDFAAGTFTHKMWGVYKSLVSNMDEMLALQPDMTTLIPTKDGLIANHIEPWTNNTNIYKTCKLVRINN